MASTYSPNLRLELIGTGEQQGTWGATTNTNLGTLLEEAIGGYTSVTVSDVTDTTLTTNNGSADQSRNMVINLTGALTNTRNVICPAIEKLYVVKNATTGSQSVVFKVSGQTGVTIPNGAVEFLYVDGTDARAITGSLATQDANSVTITGGTISGVTVSNTSLSNVAVVANASSLGVRDSDGSHVLSIAAGSNLTANRVLTLTSGDAARTLDISAGNVTISVAGAALIDDASASAQRTTLGLGTIATQNSNNVSITGGSASNVSLSNVAVVANASSLSVRDADGSNILSIAVGSNLTVNRVLTLTTGDAARTLDISSGNVTISTAGAALIDDADASAQRTTLGLGTIATQNSNNVTITGGSISGITDLAVLDGGTGASDAATARTNLGIGTIATQNSNNVTITGGSISGITDLAVADGGTGASDAATARTNLGIGTIGTQNSNNVSITGGSISGITDLALADGGTGASLSDPNANAILGWNDTAGVMRFFTAGTGITINATANTISSTSTPPAANTQTFNASGTWTKPSGSYTFYKAQIWGAGGSGGAGRTNQPPGGGGGGGYVEFVGSISDLGATETVTVGAGGTAVAANANGNSGGASSLTRANSSTITAYGGGGGQQSATGGGGGGGGSFVAVGGSASGVTGGIAGAPDAGNGGAGNTGVAGSRGTYGGGGGGGGQTDAALGGGAGGASGYGGGGGGGGSADSAPGPGAGGVSIFGGNGGAGAFDANTATSGSQPGGGGGGSEAGTSGAGGAGRVIVTVW